MKIIAVKRHLTNTEPGGFRDHGEVLGGGVGPWGYDFEDTTKHFQ